MLGVQKSWLSGSSVSAIFLVKTLCPLQPIGVRMCADRQTELVSNMPSFFCYHCINIHIDVRCVVQYFVNITQHMSTMETCRPFGFFSVCLFFVFYSILIARRQLVSVLTLGETLSSREVSQQPPSTQCWVRSGWNFNFGWTTPFNEIECNMCVKHNAAHGHTFATTVCTRPRRALFSCQLGLRVHVVQSTHGQLRNAAPHGCPDANRLLQIS